jgi:tetratricopeptide (TPR) repeat protein
MAYYYKGESRQVIESGNRLLEHAQKWSDIRNMTMGYSVRALGYHNAGDLTSAIDYCQKAIQVSLEPLFTYNAKLILGMCYVADRQFQEAEKLLEEIMRFGNESGYEYLRIAAQAFQGIVMVTKGDLSQGIKIVENAIQDCLEQGIRYRYAVLNHMLGKVYLQIAQGGSGEKSFSFILKNIGFLIKTIPFAARKAEGYLHTTIETAKEIGAKSLLGQAYLDLGRLHKAKGRLAEARTCISQAVQSFEECEADVYLKQAREALASLG